MAKRRRKIDLEEMPAQQPQVRTLLGGRDPRQCPRCGSNHNILNVTSTENNNGFSCGNCSTEFKWV